MVEKLTTFDPAEGLTSDEAVAVFMEEAFKTGNVGYIAHAQALARKYTADKPEASVDAFLANRRADSGE